MTSTSLLQSTKWSGTKNNNDPRFVIGDFCLTPPPLRSGTSKGFSFDHPQMKFKKMKEVYGFTCPISFK